ncbi:lactate utilization protein [Chitinophaga pendula]|uniref:LutC/YkgG family protein n=1 Tax=Chitinophaga TaxID=79328 RepID=UPI0012FE1A6A|nr:MULTISPECIES: LUD domain-containing protein [Chitinophaga]UCJ10017.1 lactate utilization protein [Chitinophaga pendula]
MNSRERILAAVKTNQPAYTELPSLAAFQSTNSGSLDSFRTSLDNLGARSYLIHNTSEIEDIIRAEHPALGTVIATEPGFYSGPAWSWQGGDGRQLEHVDMAIIRASLGVAENGAVWIPESQLQARVLPFITQHLSVVLSAAHIVPTLHDAYTRLGAPEDGFGVFLAGPSKTADIEQSLVLGAHGAKSLMVFILLPDPHTDSHHRELLNKK